MKKSKIGVVIALLVKWSGIAMVDGRGKVGGTVLSRSRSGATARNKVTPINRRTVAQSYIRSLFTSFSQTFRTLGDSVIAAWNAFADNNLNQTNIFGDVVKNTGINLYIRLNIVLSLLESTVLTSPPDITDVPAPLYRIDPIADVSSATLFVRADFGGGVTVCPAGTALLVYVTSKLSPGVSYVKSQYRYLTYIAATDDTATENLWSLYVAKYGAPAVGERIYIACQAANNVSGISGTPVPSTLFIQA